uniref:VWFA domain-containing protein n=1 Tax=Acrobeloides nanus TaxID=290746 RepID=A0A914EH65_9BILA
MASTLEGLKTSLSSPSKTVIIVGVVLILGVLILIAGGIMLGIGIHKSNQKEYIYITNEPVKDQSTITPPGGSQSTTTPGSGTNPSSQPQSTLTGNNASPTTPVPEYNLDNATVYSPIVADIVILLDISSATNATIVKDINDFFNQTFQAFNISTGPNSPGYIHFAILRIPGDSWGVALVAADFNTVTSIGLLQMALKNAAADPIYDPPVTAGQTLLNQALNVINGTNFLIDGGYRTSIQNHLAIYVTTNSAPSAADIALAQTLRGNSTYQFMALAYQSDGTNINALTQFVGGPYCVLQASSRPELLNTVPAYKLATKILTAWKNGTGDYFCNTSSIYY